MARHRVSRAWHVACTNRDYFVQEAHSAEIILACNSWRLRRRFRACHAAGRRRAALDHAPRQPSDLRAVRIPPHGLHRWIWLWLSLPVQPLVGRRLRLRLLPVWSVPGVWSVRVLVLGRRVAAASRLRRMQAEVFVDGYRAGIVDNFDGIFQRLHVRPGGHDLVVYLPGYRTFEEHSLREPGSSQSIKMTLLPLAPGEAMTPAVPQPSYPRPRGRRSGGTMRLMPPVQVGPGGVQPHRQPPGRAAPPPSPRRHGTPPPPGPCRAAGRRPRHRRMPDRSVGLWHARAARAAGRRHGRADPR